MRPVFDLFLMLLSILICLQLLSDLIGAEEITPTNAQTQLPKIFEWARYKNAFHKVYPTLRDELARKKVFIANVLKTFAHNLAYKLGRFTYYLSVNQFSDNTPQELKDMFKYHVAEVEATEAHDQMMKSDVEVFDGLSIEELKKELARVIVEKQSDHAIKRQLLQSRIDRHYDKIKPGLDDRIYEYRSMNDVPMPEESSKFVRKVPSTNVNYEPIEPMSQGSGDIEGHTITPLPEDQLSLLERVPGIDFVWNQVSSLMPLFDNYILGLYNANRALTNQDPQQGSSISDLVGIESLHAEEYYLDLRDSGCLTIPRSQGVCGSCYAFATVAAMEYLHCKETGELVPFSEQYMIDCGTFVGLNGCNGGYLSISAGFVMNWGVELLANYPYLEKQNSCPYNAEDWHKSGYKKPTMISVDKVKDRTQWPGILRDVGPMLIGIGAPEDFAFYGGSIHPGHNCRGQGAHHAVLLVGHGIDNGREYWIIRNSHGYLWGDGGYFKLEKDAPEDCYITANEVSFDFSRPPKQLPEDGSGYLWSLFHRGKMTPYETHADYLRENMYR